MIAAAQSGNGKTSIALAFMNTLRRQGFSVLPFKCGPDYIDTALHNKACGQPSYNLDTWINGPEACLKLFNSLTGRAYGWISGRSARSVAQLPGSVSENDEAFSQNQRNVAVVEGVMGLFDGAGNGPAQGKSRPGSPAFLAKTLGIPVILVLDAGAQGHSIAALAQGFANFDPDLRIAGLLINKVGSPKHADILREALREHCPAPPLLGLLPKRPELAIPSRHLGLELSDKQDQTWFNNLGDWLEAALAMESGSSVELLAKLQPGAAQAGNADTPQPPMPGKAAQPKTPAATRLATRPVTQSVIRPAAFPAAATGPAAEPAEAAAGLQTAASGGAAKRPRIGIARDEAFSFHYAANHLALRQAGAELIFFSPMHDHNLPADLDGLWLGGGYPELHARVLSGNTRFLSSIRDFCRAGFPVWAECGGFLYLCNGIEDASAQFWPLAGIFDLNARMETKRQGLGYVSASFLQRSPVCPQGEVCRGQIFHYAGISNDKLPEGLLPLHRLANAREEPLDSPGCVKSGTRCAGSFLHLLMSPGDRLSRYFVKTCSVSPDKIT